MVSRAGAGPQRVLRVRGNLKDFCSAVDRALICCAIAQSGPALRPHELQHARLSVHHQLPELAQTHMHPVGEAVQPCQPCPPLLPPSVFPSISLFQYVRSLHQMAKVLELQHQSFQ